jgi:hypothetical protein
MPTPNEFRDFRFVPDTSAERSGDSLQSTTDGRTPETMAAQVSRSEDQFSELQVYLNNSLATPGCRVGQPGDEPWRSPHPEKSGPGDGKTGI